MASRYHADMSVSRLIATIATLAILGTTGLVVTSRRQAAAPVEPLWVLRVRELDRALAAGNVSAAASVWPVAWHAALATRRWDAMLAVGDAAVRLGRRSRTSSAAHTDARRAYLLAFERARRERSTEGVLRVAEAFAALGDRDVVHDALRVARALAATRDPGVREHVQLEAARIAAASAPPRWVTEDQWTSN
jgi:hypothetical protein